MLPHLVSSFLFDSSYCFFRQSFPSIFVFLMVFVFRPSLWPLWPQLSHLCTKRLAGASAPGTRVSTQSQGSLLSRRSVSSPPSSPSCSRRRSPRFLHRCLFPQVCLGKAQTSLLDSSWRRLAGPRGQAVRGAAPRLSSSAAVWPRLLLAPLVCPPCWS